MFGADSRLTNLRDRSLIPALSLHSCVESAHTCAVHIALEIVSSVSTVQIRHLAHAFYYARGFRRIDAMRSDAFIASFFVAIVAVGYFVVIASNLGVVMRKILCVFLVQTRSQFLMRSVDVIFW